MGYFDGLAASTFKTDGRGGYFVMPYGVWGKTRRFRTEHDYDRARSFLITAYQVILPLIFLGVMATTLISWWVIAVLFAIILPATFVIHRNITKNSEPIDAHDTLSESLARSGNAHSGTQLWLMFLLSIAFTVGGAFLVTRGQVMGYAAVAFFGLGTIIFAIMLMKRR